MIRFTVPLFFVAFAVALAAQGLDIYDVHAWNVGTVKAEPWRTRAGAIARVVASMLGFAWLGRLLRSRAALVSLSVALALLAAHVNDASAHTVLFGMAGTIEMADVKKSLDESNQAFHGQFLELNTKIKALEAEGKTVDPILKEVREKLNDAIEKGSALNEAYIKQQATIQRLEKMGLPTGKGERDIELEARTFNIERRSIAAAKGAVVLDASVDEYRAYTKAFDRYLRVGEKALTAEEARAMSVGTDSSGGYLVTPDKTGQLVKKVFETSDVRRFASVQPISTDALEGSADLDEASGGWVSELGTRSDSNTPAVPTPWRIPVNEQYSQPKASQKLVNDALIDVGAWLMEKVSDKLGRDQNVAFVTGSGVGKPRGFASYTTSTTYAWGTPEHVGTGSAGAWGTDPNGIQKLNTLMGLLKDTYTAGAGFFMNRTTKFSVRNLTDASSAGKFVFIPSFQAGVPDVLLGAPVNVFQDMVSYSTSSALAVAYGNMARYYQIVDRQGISVLVDPYTSKPYVIFYTTARVGGDVVDFEAMKFLKFV